MCTCDPCTCSTKSGCSCDCGSEKFIASLKGIGRDGWCESRKDEADVLANDLAELKYRYPNMNGALAFAGGVTCFIIAYYLNIYAKKVFAAQLTGRP